jgi:hypothetical protein
VNFKMFVSGGSYHTFRFVIEVGWAVLHMS